ncbi:MAG TPA: ribonuclease III, partial [Acidimicrobiales bacterium]|nr:ribonuclease III [Acidimicrobiales bacterium]
SLGDRVREAIELPGSDDHKTRLQEEAAGRFGSVPAYEIAEEGPDHAKTFMARVTIDGREWGRGRGRSKKRAQQEAARVAWEAMTEPTRETQSS